MFYPQTNGQMERQNSTTEAYLEVFINWEQDDWARLLPMAEIVYHNAKNASIGRTSFELNWDFHPKALFKENVDFRSGSCLVKKQADKLRELIEVSYQNLVYAQELQKEPTIRE